MTFSRFMVIGWEETNGLYVDHFNTLAEAEAFARLVSTEGFTAQVVEQRSIFHPVQEEDETPEMNGVIPGVDFPATLSKQYPDINLVNRLRGVA